MTEELFKMEWEAHEYEHKERSRDWFWAVGIIAVGVAIVSIILGNVILGILILVGAFSLSLFINRPPETVHIEVNERGIVKGKILYPFSTLKSFYIDLEHPHNKIILKSEKLFMPLIIIPLNDEVDVEELHEFLSQVIDEEFHSLPFVEKVLEFIGF